MLAGCLLAPGLSAQPAAAYAPKKPAPAAKQGNRFLFIVDVSSSMEKHRDEELSVVDEILRSNANGQLHQNDTIGVWTFNTEIFTGNLPLQVWLPEQRQEIALRTEEFIREQPFRKKSRFDVALSGMFQVIKNSDIITVFIISNGDGKMQGSPFDDEINALYLQNVKEMKHGRTPVVTVLEAKGGKIVKYTVNAVPWPVIVPELPVVLKAEAEPPAAPAAPLVAAAPKPAPIIPAPVPQPPPMVASTPAAIPTNLPPIVTTHPSPPPMAQSVPVAIPTNLPPIVTTFPGAPSAAATPAAQPESPPVAQAAPASPIVNPLSPGASMAPAVRRPRSVPHPAEALGSPIPPNIPPAASKPETSTPPPATSPVALAAPTIPVAKAAPADTAPTAPTTGTPEPTPATQPAKSFVDRMLALIAADGGTRRFLLIGGVALLVLGLGLILLLVRRSRRPPERISLISHVMDNRHD
jgi:hypothetical protein